MDRERAADPSDNLTADILLSTDPTPGATLEWAQGDVAAFTLSAGAYSITDQTPNVSIAFVRMTFDNALNVSSWEIAATNPNGGFGGSLQLVTRTPGGERDTALFSCPSFLCPLDATVTGNAGTWTGLPVPEPSAALLLGAGLAACVGWSVARGRHSAAR